MEQMRAWPSQTTTHMEQRALMLLPLIILLKLGHGAVINVVSTRGSPAALWTGVTYITLEADQVTFTIIWDIVRVE